MKKKEALEYIRKVKGYVPYIGVFDIFDENRDEIPQELIDLSCAEDRPSGNFLITNSAIAEQLKELNKNSH